MEEQFYDLSSFAVDDPGMEGMSLIDTIRKVKPNILIGEICQNISNIIHHDFRSVCLWGPFQ